MNMDAQKALALAVPASGAYLGVAASQLIGVKSPLMAALIGICGAGVGLWIAGRIR